MGYFTYLQVGLKPRPHPFVATTLGILLAGLTLPLIVTALLAVAAIGDHFAWSEWIATVADLSNGTKLWAHIEAHRPILFVGLGISVCAGFLTCFEAWVRTPWTEPFQTPDDADPHVYYDDDARMKLQWSFLKEAGANAAEGFWLAPYLNLPHSLESRNILVVGASGHGKSNIVRAIATQTIERGDRAVIHCNKGDVTRSFDLRDVVLISPAHRDGWAWDIGADLDGPAAAAEFARDIIPSSDQPFWSDSARLILADTINAISAEKGRHWGPLDLLTTLLSSPDELRLKIAKIDLSASPLLASGEEGSIDKTVQGIMSTLLSAALTTLRPMAYAWAGLPPEKHFSIKRWLASEYKGPKIVIVQTSPNFEAMSTSVCGGVLRRICKAVSDASMAVDQSLRTTLILDELFSLGKIEGLATALSVAREKGLICIAAVQSMEQLRLLYQDEAVLLSDLFQIKIYSRLTAGEGATDASNTLGSRAIRWQAVNRNPAHDDKRRFITKDETKPIVTATQFGRDFGLFEANTSKEYIRAIVHYAGAAHRFDWPATKWAVKGEGFVAAAWTRF
jgi:NAD(P)-dependent dehydrogenase (short-subunit alcohol dehydrogenase family)